MSTLHEVLWGNTAIRYALHRSARKKTLSLRVEPDGSVVVFAPETVPELRIAAIVRKKAQWIVERLRRVADVPPAPTPRKYVSGESFQYLGRQYRLKVQRGETEGVRLSAGFLIITVSRTVAAAERPDHIRSLLIDWYRSHATERLPFKVSELSARIGVTPKTVFIREPKQRWGSCDANGALRLNWRIIQAPPKLIDYVIAHELIHIPHPNHSPTFWSNLGRVMPDYEQRRETLRKIGAFLVW